MKQIPKRRSTRKKSNLSNGPSEQFPNTELPKFVHDLVVGSSSNTLEVPTPDPVHGVGRGDTINGQRIVGTSIRVGVRIEAGTFGHLRAARNLKTNELLAVKLESNGIEHSKLENEWQIYKTLNKTPSAGIAKAFCYGHCGTFRAMAMEMLGPSLEQVFGMCGRNFSIHTTLMLTVQMINRLQYLHEQLIVHRDLNPTNFLISCPPKQDNIVYMIDFGVSKYYVEPNTKTHIGYSENEHRVGTASYMSLRAHLGIEQSRRDDLESLGYILIYFLRGSLPWEELAKVQDEANNKLIFHMKKSLSVSELCKDQPREFARYMQYVRRLDFQQTPDYNYLSHMFILRLELLGLHPEGRMDWHTRKRQTNQ